MRFSFWISNDNTWDDYVALGRAAEAAGWDGLWVADHFMLPPGGFGIDGFTDRGEDAELNPLHECWSLLAGLAAAVPRVRLGAMVTGNTYRHPAVLAKQAATVDHISGGRLVLGLGAGWQENEHRRYGIEYGTVKERADKLDEACAVITGLFANERTDFNGVHYQLQGAPLAPKPLQNPLPLMIGGMGKRRTIPTAVRYAHEWNGWVTAGGMRHFRAYFKQLCEEADRDPADIQYSAALLLFLCDSEAEAKKIDETESGRPVLVGTPAQLVEKVAKYAQAGADELIIPTFNMTSTAQAHERIQQFMSEVVTAL